MLTGCRHIISSAANCVKLEVAALGRASQSIEGLDKLAKLVVGILDSSQYVIGDVLIPFKAPFKLFTDFTSGLNIIGRVDDLADNEKRNKIKKDGVLGWSKYTSLAVGHVCHTVKLLNTVKIINLGQFAGKTCTLNIFGAARVLPGISTIGDVAIGVTSVLGIVMSYKKLTNPNLPRRQELIQYKIDKFENKLKFLQAQKNGRRADIDKYYELMDRSVLKYKTFEKKYGKIIQPEIEKKQAEKCKGSKARDAKEQIKTCKWSLETWKKLKGIPDNEKRKAKLSIINDLFKIALISLSLATIFVSALLLAPAFAIFGLLAGYTGYRKFAMDSAPLGLSPKPKFA